MKLFLILTAGFLLLFCAGGCERNESIQDANNTTGTLVLRLTDAPAGYDHVYIVVDSVLAHIASNDSVSGWITINSTPAVYDLLKLVNGADTVIGNARLPVGYYSQIRLVIGEGSSVVVDGSTYPLKTPSGQQSGVKLNVHVKIEPDIVYTLTLDFDAHRSIVKTGNGQYILKPVIRTIATGTTGIISGAVMPASAHPVVMGYASADTVSTFADTSGYFKLIYLPPALYSVYIMPSDTLHRDTTITGVAVYPGQTTNIGTIYLNPE